MMDGLINLGIRKFGFSGVLSSDAKPVNSFPLRNLATPDPPEEVQRRIAPPDSDDARPVYPPPPEDVRPLGIS